MLSFSVESASATCLEHLMCLNATSSLKISFPYEYHQVIGVLQTDPEYSGEWQTVGSTKALVRRAAIGIILALGPYNYPLNETYATIIPALLMGNVVLLKVPTVGGLVHFLTSKFGSFFIDDLSKSEEAILCSYACPRRSCCPVF